MIVLTKCKQLGIRIPATLVTNTKAELMHFLTKHEKIITKSIVSPSGNVVINGINYTFSAPTVLLTDSDIKKSLNNSLLLCFKNTSRKNMKYGVFSSMKNCSAWQYSVKRTKRHRLISEITIIVVPTGMFHLRFQHGTKRNYFHCTNN